MEIRILGPVEIDVGGAVIRPRRRQERFLLALLALERERFLTLDRLVDLLWDQSPPAAARPAVHAMMSRLRAALNGTAASIATRGTAYALIAPPDTVDAWRFWSLIEAAAGAVGAERVDVLRSALALWRGPALADAVEHGDGGYVGMSLDEQRMTCYEDLWEAELRLGNSRGVVDESAAMVRQNPLRERLVRVRMLALHQAGRTAEALEAYAELSGRMREDLGLEPGEQTQRLQRAILRDDPETRLVEATEPGPGHVRNPPAQLPSVAGHFVGRADEMRQLDTLADVSSSNTVVISAIAGTAGIGKTALGVYWAHRARGRFPDGQLYLDLRGFSSDSPVRSGDALAIFLRALGVPTDEIPSDLAAAAARYRTELADKRLLVFLDNASDVDQVRPLLPGGQRCRVIITSRNALGGLVAREGAHRVVLGALPADQAIELLTAILGHDRVHAQLDLAAELAQACGYLPLALRIAAANLLAEPDREFEDYLVKFRAAPLSSLEVPGDPLGAVHAAFDLSYHSLSPAARRLFRLFGVVPGPHVSPEAAAALWAGEPGSGSGVPGSSTGVIAQLLDAHLLDEPEPGRYVLHDLLREYAATLAGSDEDRADGYPSAVTRLYDWYMAGLDAAAGVLYPQMARLPGSRAEVPADTLPGIDDEGTALAWVARELPNLMAAVASAAVEGPRRYAWRIADALRGYFWNGRGVVGWLDIAEQALAAARAEGDPGGEAAAELNLSNRAWSLGEPRSALAHLERALPLIRRAGWRSGEAAALGNMGSLLAELGQLERAAEYQLDALEIDRELGWVQGIAMRLSNLGVVYEDLGRVREAIGFFEEARSHYRSCASVDGEAVSLTHLSLAHRLVGELETAIAEAFEGARLHRSAGNRHSEAFALLSLSQAYNDIGRQAEARALADGVLLATGEMGDRRLEAVALDILGLIDVAEGDVVSAERRLREVLDIAEAAELGYYRAYTRCQLAAICAGTGRLDVAERLADEAFDTMRADGILVLHGEVLYTQALVKRAAGQLTSARALAERALAAFDDCDLRPGSERSRLLLDSIDGQIRGAHAQ